MRIISGLHLLTGLASVCVSTALMFGLFDVDAKSVAIAAFSGFGVSMIAMALLMDQP